MGHSQAEKRQTHERIVNVAAKRFRERGIEGISIADIMKEVGATVGGFYRHFDSRDDLVAEAVAVAFEDMDTWKNKTRKNLRSGIKTYLSAAHRNELTTSCVFSSLSTDIHRSNSQTRELFTERLRGDLELLESMIRPELDSNRPPKPMLLSSSPTRPLQRPP